MTRRVHFDYRAGSSGLAKVELGFEQAIMLPVALVMFLPSEESDMV